MDNVTTVCSLTTEAVNGGGGGDGSSDSSSGGGSSGAVVGTVVALVSGLCLQNFIEIFRFLTLGVSHVQANVLACV